MARAQTEPLAALVAVMALLAGVGIYAVSLGSVFPGMSDRAVEETTIDRLWDDLEDDGSGVFPAYEYTTEMDREMRETLDQASLPNGKNSYIEIRAYKDGKPTVLASAHFDSDGDDLQARQLESTHPDYGPPRGAGESIETGIATRPISIEVTKADVRGGTLHVEVW
ncbi:DUF7285 family protein [Natronorubrum sulfidifaciens]|uniref:Uncharacterized protein n=1 Tax=Natronorubrum sulfidifaciens JCM 14089 TaxID=1230460 RepID=L9WFF7_9EURY|nr:hypothetical protein [Natronorubrum sulfidifaciens]ELY48199.1 hypothetical protein C495_01955 [Natronorubrum sulfidifaciens JCM 14089]